MRRERSIRTLLYWPKLILSHKRVLFGRVRGDWAMGRVTGNCGHGDLERMRIRAIIAIGMGRTHVHVQECRPT